MPIKESLIELLEENGEPGPVLRMIHDRDPENTMLPMTASPRFYMQWAQDHPDDPDAEAMIEDMKNLRRLGVTQIPLYESRMEGLRWRPFEGTARREV